MFSIFFLFIFFPFPRCAHFPETASCSYACNGFGFAAPLESIAYLRTQLAKEDFLNQVIGALFGFRYHIVIERNTKASGNGDQSNSSQSNSSGRRRSAFDVFSVDQIGDDSTTIGFAIPNCVQSDPNISKIWRVVSGLARDIVPNASLLTSTVTGCRMATSSSSPGTAWLHFIALLIYCLCSILIYLWEFFFFVAFFFHLLLFVDLSRLRTSSAVLRGRPTWSVHRHPSHLRHCCPRLSHSHLQQERPAPAAD
jgi:hypothetical protein